MTIALLIGGYLSVALLLQYVDARMNNGESEMGPAWLVWPLLLPVLALMGAFMAVEALADRHSK
jgi:hypothetical protein